MTTKHTAGPWTVSKSPSHNGYRVTSSDVDTGLDVSVFAPYGRREKERQEQALADAHLIASAPDLVEALQDCVDALSIHAPDVWSLVQARALIAKIQTE